VWWQRFGDPTLDALIARALAGSPSLQATAARIDQARAQLRITTGGRGPQVQGQVSDQYSKPDALSRLLDSDDGSQTLQVGAQATWELDLWGQVRRGIEADSANLLATEAGWQAARVSLAATVASTYLSARTLERRLSIARASLRTQAENLRIARARQHAGAASELDVRQAQTQYGLTAAPLPTLQAGIERAWHAVGVLVGGTPDDGLQLGATPGPEVVVPDEPTLALPRDLLRRRPDVVQAELAAVSQSARIGQAQAALYPSFTLGGSFGFSATDAGHGSLGDLFSWDSRLLTLGASLTLPLFDRGRLVAQVDVQDALFRQALLSYQNQVLVAQQEVADALSDLHGGEAARDTLSQAREAARRGAELALQRYRAGQNDYTTVVSAEQSRLQVEDEVARAEGDLLQAHVTLYRALGGGWSGELQGAAWAPDAVSAVQVPSDTETSPRPSPVLSPPPPASSGSHGGSAAPPPADALPAVPTPAPDATPAPPTEYARTTADGLAAHTATRVSPHSQP